MKQRLKIVLTAEFEGEYDMQNTSAPVFKDQLKDMILEDPDLLLELSGTRIFCTVVSVP